MADDTTHTAHFAANQANWDDRAPLHAARDAGYKTQQYISDARHISNVVRFDLPRLGDITALRAVHLQCHIGTDTLSLSRLGASPVVGLDFSPASIAAARALVAETGDAVTFIEGNVHDARTLLEGDFDLVFTGVGALCWLPDIKKWAEVVASLLAPGGRMFLREDHPILGSVDESLSDGPTLRFPYFSGEGQPLEWEGEETYVDTAGGKLAHTKTYQWNRGLGEIVTALLGAGLVLEVLEEHDSVPWEALPGIMEKGELDEWRLRERSGCMPLSYTIIARRPVGSTAAR